MGGFFRADAAANEGLYADISQASNSDLRKARRLTELMWSSCGQFVDANAPERARKDDFHAVWWELYLAYALSGAGISLVSRKSRPRSTGKGRPDLLANNPRVWIEAVMPQPGTGADALIEPPPQRVFDVPSDKFVLRLAAAFREKSDKVLQYIKDGTIPASDAIIIAISGGRLPFRLQDYPIPNIVRALCGVGYLGIDLDVKSRRRLGSYVELRDHVDKKSKSSVQTDPFLRRESVHVSGVLYSCADCVTYPRTPGREFILVHNPNASVPLPGSWLPVGEQFWVQNDELQRGRPVGRNGHRSGRN